MEVPRAETASAEGESTVLAVADNLEDLLLPTIDEPSEDCKVVETPEMLDC